MFLGLYLFIVLFSNHFDVERIWKDLYILKWKFNI